MNAPAPRTIGRRILVGDLDRLYGTGQESTARREAVLSRLRQALDDGNRTIRDRFHAGQLDGLAASQAQSRMSDAILRTVHELAALREYPSHNPTTADRLTLLAVGGYGRGELAPFSDIDILFLHPYKPTPRIEQLVEWMLYILWDLGLKLGYAVRSLPECLRVAQQDFTVRTALLESRYLTGDQDLLQDFRRRFEAEVVTGSGRAFVTAKLDERNARHKRMGDSRFLLEPNIKDGKGGLRDLQTLYWIGKYLYRVHTVAGLVAAGVLTATEARRFHKAATLLWCIRFHLHYLAGRADDRLGFEAQTELARRMGYLDRAGATRVERFMKHYYLVAKRVGALTRIFCAAIAASQPGPWPTGSPATHPGGWPASRRTKTGLDGLVLRGGMLTTPDPGLFATEPAAMMRLFHVSLRCGAPPHPEALQQVTRHLRRIDQTVRDDPAINRMFLDILTARSGLEASLRLMNECGLFGRFMPDFGRVVGQTQHDMYHVFTVDEHSIIAMGLLNGMESGRLQADHPLATAVIPKIQSRRALYVATLFHDIAKGRGGDHSVIGAGLAEKAGPRLGLDAEETETVAWLVLHHLAMSRVAFKRDLSDPKTIADFAALVQSPERLKLLLCLTVVDIRAVGPRVWNNWKATLLRELYHATDDYLSGGHGATDRDARVAGARQELAAVLADWPATALASHWNRGFPGYWLAFDTDTLAKQARLMRAADESGATPSLEVEVPPGHDATVLTLYTRASAGLFARVAAIVAACGASVVAARIFTTPTGMVLNVFRLQDGEGKAFVHGQDRLRRALGRRLAGAAGPEAEPVPTLAQHRLRLFDVPPRVMIDNQASRTHTVIEVNGRDRPGFLSAVAATLHELDLQLASARVATFGERVVDVFYVKDAFGMKITHPTRIRRIRTRLLAAAATRSGSA